MLTNNRTNNRVNQEQVCSLNIEQSRLLQFTKQPWGARKKVQKVQLLHLYHKYLDLKYLDFRWYHKKFKFYRQPSYNMCKYFVIF